MRRLIRRSLRVLVVVAVGALGLIGVGGGTPAGAAPIGFVTLAVQGDCVLATLDLDTGQGTPVGDPQPFDCTDLAFAPDGTLYGLVETEGNTAQLVVWNTTTGDATVIDSIDALTTNGQQGGLTFTVEGALYALLVEPPVNGAGAGAAATACPDGDFAGPTCLFQVDPTDTTTPTFIGETHDGRVGGLDVGCSAPAVTLASSDLLNAGAGEETQADVGPLNHGPGEDAILTSVDLGTGAGTAIGTGIGAGSLIRSLAYDATEALWGVGYDPELNEDSLSLPPGAAQIGDDRVYTIDRATGVATEHADLVIDGIDPDLSDPTGLAIAPLACEAPLVVAFTG